MKKSVARIHTWAVELLSATPPAEQASVAETLRALQEVLHRLPEVRRVLGDAVISPDDRIRLIEQARGVKLPVALHETIRAMMAAEAFALFPALIDHVRQIRDRFGVVREVTAVSAVPLASRESDRLRGALETTWKIPVLLHERVDPRVIGGFRLEADDWRFDATVVGGVKRLAEFLIAQ